MQTPRTVVEQAKEVGMSLSVKPWEFLSNIAKDSARNWFKTRAEERGIAWSTSVESFQAQQPELDRLYSEICNPSVQYPSYYTQAFHSYDDGNLNWQAAHELEAATQSMCLGYYDGIPWQEAQEIYRGAARQAIADRWQATHGESMSSESSSAQAKPPRSLLDIGCSGGFSTAEMAKAFPGVEATGLDLSPHFLSVAKLGFPELEFVHGRAESTGFADGAFDVVTFNFLFHELPLDASLEALREAYRILAPGGVIAILDVDPRRLLELPAFRRWAFQVTEPWCKEGEYYSLKLDEALAEIGFQNVEIRSNDPVNQLVLATKAME